MLPGYDKKGGPQSRGLCTNLFLLTLLVSAVYMGATARHTATALKDDINRLSAQNSRDKQLILDVLQTVNTDVSRITKNGRVLDSLSESTAHFRADLQKMRDGIEFLTKNCSQDGSASSREITGAVQQMTNWAETSSRQIKSLDNSLSGLSKRVDAQLAELDRGLQKIAGQGNQHLPLDAKANGQTQGKADASAEATSLVHDPIPYPSGTAPSLEDLKKDDAGTSREGSALMHDPVPNPSGKAPSGEDVQVGSSPIVENLVASDKSET